MLEALVAGSAEAGLQVNNGKRKYVCNIQDSGIYIGTKEIEKSKDYIYISRTDHLL